MSPLDWFKKEKPLSRIIRIRRRWKCSPAFEATGGTKHTGGGGYGHTSRFWDIYDKEFDKLWILLLPMISYW